MRTNGMPNETAFASSHRQKKTWLTVLAVLAAVVALATIAALTMPASAMTAQDSSTPETAAAETTEEPETPAAEAAAVDTAAEETPVLPATPETAQGIAVEQAAAEAAALPKSAQIPEGYTVQRTVRDEENGFAVTVYAPEGVIPEDATLSAKLLQPDSEEYKQAGEQLAEQTDLLPADGTAALSLDGENADGETTPAVGYAALDIHFEDADGNEIEPDGEVYVTIDAAGLLPEDADPESVTVQHHAEDADAAQTAGAETPAVTVETVADTAPAEEGIEGTVAVTTPDAATETATEETTVTAPEGKPATEVQAAFAVDGFSIFTITWHGDWDIRLPVHCVDENGKEIGGGLATLNVPEKDKTLSIDRNNAPEIDGYRFEKAVVADDTNGIATGNNVSQVRVQEDRRDWYWQYRSTSSSKWNNIDDKTVYLVYSEGESGSSDSRLDEVATVDSTAQGVHMYMFDYPAKEFNGGEYATNNGSVKQGLASETVGTDGWPTLTGVSGTISGTSFSEFFGGSDSAYNVDSGYAVNHLFLQSNYNKNGEFYYSAFENFATLGATNDGNFTVYEQLGTNGDQNSSTYYFQRGNFMPYNTLNPTYVRNHNRYSDTGQALSGDDDRYNENLYGFYEDDNFYFGMYVWADFYQPQGGMVEDNPKEGVETPEKTPMRFEFTGDDDMWVYIDGVLVLDLGGIHDAQSGYIDFRTGEVRWTATRTGSDNANWQQPTDLKTIFTNANRVNATNWNGNTFADGSSHRIQIFYMERGAGASNLKMSFNLKTIPDGQVAVSKTVENYYAPQTEDIEYTMKIETRASDDAEWQPYIGTYTLYEQGDTQYTTSSEDRHEGEFTIKHGDTAVFSDIPVETQVRAQEVAVSDNQEFGVNIEDGYKVSCVVTDSGGQPLYGSKVENGVATANMPGYGSINVDITNTATFTRPLKLVKNFEGTTGNAAPAGFEATYTLYEQVPDSSGETTEPVWKEVGSIKYSDLENGQYIFWLETDKTYKIEETVATDVNGNHLGDTETLKWNRVTVLSKDSADDEKGSTDGYVTLVPGDATEGNDIDTIIMTNYYGKPTVSLTIIKNIYGLDEKAVEALVNGENGESGLRFDVDGFTDDGYLINDEKGVTSGYPSGHDNWNDWGDRTFSVSDTLDGNGFVNDSWKDEISTPGGTSIAESEKEYYTNISMTKVTPEGGDPYYRYEVTITNMPVDIWFRVWEMHPDLDGYSVSSTVAEYLTQATGEDKLGNYLTTDEVMNQTGNRGDHGGRATAFQLTEDTTVEFTNTYTAWPDITVTKVDSTNTNIKLPNAEFYVTKTTGTGTDAKIVYYCYSNETEKTTWVEANSDKSNVTKLISDEDGTFTIHGLEDGQYTLVEVKAPDGYQLPAVNFEFGVIGGHVNYKNVNEGTNVTVTNTTGTELPETGGMGTNFLTIGGLLLMAAAVGGGCVLRRRRGKEAG